MCNETSNGRINCQIIENKEIASDIFKMVVEARPITENAQPGQFVNIYCQSKEKLLPRPISICEIDKENSYLKLVYAVVGSGTKEMATYVAGDSVDILGPLGNGYDIKNVKRSILVGGGVGTPPLVELAKNIEGEKLIYIGFRSDPYLINELEKYGKVYVATEDGSVGHKGNIIELLNQNEALGDIIYACGPKPMLKALQDWSNEKKIPTQLSLEERMGCGFGACVGCVCKIKTDDEIGFRYVKVCKDGPVFDAREVIL